MLERGRNVKIFPRHIKVSPFFSRYGGVILGGGLREDHSS